MRSRDDFIEMILAKTSVDESHMYFQPPENVTLKYPCFIYHLNHYDVDHADDMNYKELRAYTVTIISKDPDYEVPVEMIRLPYCSFDRYYAADNLNHWAFKIYY